MKGRQGEGKVGKLPPLWAIKAFPVPKRGEEGGQEEKSRVVSSLFSGRCGVQKDRSPDTPPWSREVHIQNQGEGGGAKRVNRPNHNQTPNHKS